MEKKTNRLYKSRLFVMIFEDKKNLLELYNAVSGKNYKDPEMLEINTLENVIYMSMINDLSFIIDVRLSLYEHQSTFSPNLPLRFLLYLSDLISGMVSCSLRFPLGLGLSLYTNHTVSVVITRAPVVSVIK